MLQLGLTLHRIRIQVKAITGGSIDPDYENVIDYGLGNGYRIPTTPEIILNSELVKCLKANGIWEKLDVEYFFKGGGDSDFACINVVNPNAGFNVVKTNSPIYTEGVGFHGDGSTSNLRSPYNPSIHAINYSIDSNSLLLGVIDYGTVGVDFARAGNQGYHDIDRVGSTQIYNNAIRINVYNFTGKIITNTRFGSGNMDFYLTADKVKSLQDYRSGVQALATGESYALASTDAGAHMWGIGGNTSDVNDELVDCFTDWINNINPSYEDEYKAALEYGITNGYRNPTPEEDVVNNAHIVDLKAKGIWDKQDVYYMFKAGGDSDFACINFKNAGTFNTAKVNSLIYTEGVGFTGDGVSARLDTQFSESDSTNATDTGASKFFYGNINTSNNVTFYLGDNVSRAGNTMDQRNGNDNYLFSSARHSGATVFNSSTDVNMISKVSSGVLRKNAEVTNFTTDDSTSGNNIVILGGVFVGAEYSLSSCSVFGFGGEASADYANLNQAVQDYINPKSTPFLISSAFSEGTINGSQRIQRSSDNAIAFISYDGEVTLDTLVSTGDTLGVWAGVGDVVCLSPTNQEGSLAVSQVQASAPLIVSAGALVVSGGIAAFDNVGKAGWLSTEVLKLSDTKEVWIYGVVDVLNTVDQTLITNNAGGGVVGAFSMQITFGQLLFGGVISGVTLKYKTYILPLGVSLITAKLKSNTNISLGFEVWFNGVLQVESQLVDGAYGSFIDNPLQVLVRDGATSFNGKAQHLEIKKGDWSAENLGYIDELNEKYKVWLTTGEQEYLDALTYARTNGYGLPTYEQQLAGSNHIADLKAKGIWDSLDVYYMMNGGGDADFASMNFKDVNAGFNSVKNNSPIYTEGVGFTGDAVAAYLDYGFTSADITLAEDDNSFGAYFTRGAAAAANMMGTNTQFYMNALEDGRARNSHTTPKQFTPAPSIGSAMFMHTDRSVAADFNINGDGVTQNFIADSNTFPTTNWVSLWTSGTAYSNGTVSLTFAGVSMQDKAADFNQAVTDYLDVLIGVNPSFETEYKDVLKNAIDNAYVLPSAEQQVKENQLIIDLKAAGVFSGQVEGHFFTTDGDSDFATINYKDVSKVPSKVNSPTFTPLGGFTGDAISAYINNGMTFDDMSSAGITGGDYHVCLVIDGYPSTGRRLFGGGFNTTSAHYQNVSTAAGGAANGKLFWGSLSSLVLPQTGMFIVIINRENGRRKVWVDASLVADLEDLQTSFSGSYFTAILAALVNITPTTWSDANLKYFAIGKGVDGKEVDYTNAITDYINSL